MNKNQSTAKRSYVRPQIKVLTLQSESLLQTASGNAGTIGQGTAGTTGSPVTPPAGGGGTGYTPYTPWGD